MPHTGHCAYAGPDVWKGWTGSRNCARKINNMKRISAEVMRKFAMLIESLLPEGMGFCLIVFPFHRPGIANYISNAERETMILALKEKIKVLESKADFNTPGEN